MRTPAAALMVGTAVVLGSLTGAYVLPAGGWTTEPSTAPPPPTVASPTPPTTSPVASSASPTPTASSSPVPTPTPTPTPTKKLTESDLLAVQSFADVGVRVIYDSQRGDTDPVSAANACADADDSGHRSLADLTGHDPAFEGGWSIVGGDSTAYQVVAVADDAADAERSLAALVASAERCERAPAGHWVYGAPTTQDVDADRSTAWFGYYDDKANTTGRAPSGAQPCGGLLLARNGARFTTVSVYMCLDADQLAGLAADAADRLG